MNHGRGHLLTTEGDEKLNLLLGPQPALPVPAGVLYSWGRVGGVGPWLPAHQYHLSNLSSLSRLSLPFLSCPSVYSLGVPTVHLEETRPVILIWKLLKRENGGQQL